MAGKEVVETIYGKRSKFEIVKTPVGLLNNTSFSIYKDGSYWKGTYDALSRAVEVAKDAG